MNKEVIKILEAQDWFITKRRDGWDLSKYSPLGEDFGFYVKDRNLIQNIVDFANDFDVDEHAQATYEFAEGDDAPDSLCEIVDDARAIKAMLDDLVKVLITKFPDEVVSSCDKVATTDKEETK